MASAKQEYAPVPPPNDAYLSRGYGPGNDANDFASTPAHPIESSPLGQSLQRNNSGLGRYVSDDMSDDRGSTVQQLEGAGLHRTASSASTPGYGGQVPSRSNTLKKKGSVGGALQRRGSLKRSNSRRSIHAGSIKGVAMADDVKGGDENSVFYTPVPTTGAPTEILANRFQGMSAISKEDDGDGDKTDRIAAWRKLLKDLITYFREVQATYEQRSKALLKVSNIINNTNAPNVFMSEGGISDANRILREYHKQSLAEANKARDIEQDVITQLSGLRADLGQKIKEIKSLSGDFKNTVEKEKEATRKAVRSLEEALAAADQDPHAAVGRDDPYIIRLGVDRQVERQTDEENYLHRAYLNLEGSGRELESIVVGEIQKAYNALAGILKRDADSAYDAVEQLRTGPITMPKDYEWTTFVDRDPHMVSPDVPLRKVDEIEYPGKNHPAAAEIRAGMLERKSKYLKSYQPGWYVPNIKVALHSHSLTYARYVLSPTHLHEFKSADRIYTQPPVMSLFLGDQKLGSHSQPGSSSHKFMLKGRQTGSMHRGHTWVFRAETYDTMLAWYDDIRSLTEGSTEERHAFVRKHARSFSQNSAMASSISGDSAMEEDEADQIPYSAHESMTASKELDGGVAAAKPQRPSPGGRFPSDLQVPYQRAHSASSGESYQRDSGAGQGQQDLSVIAGGLQHQDGEVTLPSATATGGATNAYTTDDAHNLPPQDALTTPLPYHPSQPPFANPVTAPDPTTIPPTHQSTGRPSNARPKAQPQPDTAASVRPSSYYGEWMALAAVGAGAAPAAVDTEEYWHAKRLQAEDEQHKNIAAGQHARDDGELSSPAMTESTAPTSVSGTEMTKDHAAPMVAAAISTPVRTAPPYEPVPAPGGISSTDEKELSPTGVAATEADANSTLAVATAGLQSAKAAQSGTVESPTAYDTDPLTGEPNARATGAVFPAVMRHDTDVSVSGLHIPGEYPRSTEV